MIKPYNKDNYKDILFTDHLKKCYFNRWKKKTHDKNKDPHYEIEIMINSKCNLKCKYCYYTAFGDELYPSSIDETNIISNLKQLFAFLKKNHLKPNINVFSGEPFEQEIGHEIINEIINFYHDSKIKSNLVIPTNFSFIDTQEKTDRVKKLLDQAASLNVGMYLSASVDGKYCDKNRPYRNGFIRDDEWYDKMFKFAKEYSFGFHPMIYFDEIEHWKDNFLWYTSMLEKHKFDGPNSLYLLEVRNAGWTKEHNKKLYEFSRFVTKFILDKHQDTTINKIIDTNLDYNYFNGLVITSRALPCSYETNLAIRLADLKIFPCHRLQYSQFEACQIHFDNDNKNILIESNNPEMYICSNAVKSITNYPMCEDCDINYICNGGCLGSQYETMLDPFIPIPDVCAMEYAKNKGILDEMQHDKRFGEYLASINKELRRQIKILLGEKDEQ